MRKYFLFYLSVSFILLNVSTIYSQSGIVYDEGSVWIVSLIQTERNATDDYLKGLKQTWETTMKEEVKAGLIKSYKIMLGTSANEEDFNLLLMIEYPNLAALDPDPQKLAAARTIEEKTKEIMKGEFDKTVSTYQSIRKFKGEKIMREISFK